jgi:filamentous hemagglutinin family protein
MKRHTAESACPNFAFKPTIAALAVATCFLQASLVQANPTGAQVAAGSAQFNTTGNTLTVTNAPGTIVNWQQFNIQAGETTRFNQQSGNSAILNRVVGNDLSRIYGTLQSNGQVYLVNQNGIIFGPNAIVDVNKLVASTLNLTDANFLNKNFSFSGGGYGQLLNQGKISTPLGGSVYLIGTDVRNEGIITTPQGTVVLAAGNSVSMTDSAGPELTVTVNANGSKAVNLGTINAAGGQINMFGALIEQQGVLSADSASVDAQGRIILKASDSTTVSGTISATNSVGKGGEIQVLGNNVTLTNTANLDASGATGGGTVLVGGDWQGSNANIQNATNTTMQAGAVIKADASQNGDGGKVVLWANNTTDFKGAIYARGGEFGGNGGQVETSGKQNLLLGGTVNTLAPLGNRGFWLLDPQAYCLADFSSSCLSYSSATYIPTSNLATMLNSSDVVLVATDFIVVASTVNLGSSGFSRADAKLELQAPFIDQSGMIDAGSTPLYLVMKASGNSASYPAHSGEIWSEGNIYTRGGNLVLDATSAIKLNGESNQTISLDGTFHHGADLWVRAPKLVSRTPFFAGSTTTFYLPGGDADIMVNFVDFSAAPVGGQIGWLGLSPYSAGFNVYLGKQNSAPECGVTALCLTNQFASPSFGGLFTAKRGGVYAGHCPNPIPFDNACGYENAIFDGDLFIGGYGASWGIAGSNGTEFAGRNITLNKPITAAYASSVDSFVLAFMAKEKFINLAGPNPFPNLAAGKYWAIAVGDYAGSVFGGLESQAQVLRGRNQILLDDQNEDWWSNLTNFNYIIDINPKESNFDPCVLNPTSCKATATDPNGTLSSTKAYDPTLNGPLTIAAELTADERYYASDDKGGVKGQEAKLTKSDKNKSDEEKSVEEVRAEAKEAKGKAAKADAEAKQAAAEAKAAEAEAKSAKTPEQRVAAQSRAESKRAEADVKKAQAEAKRAEADSREALADTKQVVTDSKSATPAVAAARRSEAEAKQARAESKRADAQAKQADAEAKQAATEAKSAKTPEQKEIAQKTAEAKRTEADAKRTESQSRKAEGEAKLAEAEAKTAATPQARAAAEKKAETKRVEADVKKSEAESKQAAADGKQAEAGAKQSENRAKQAEGEAKQAEAEARTAKTPEQKLAATQKAEVKKTEAQAHKADSDAKQTKAEGKQVEAQAKKAEGEAKKAEADVKQAKTPEQKAKAEQRAEAKKSEADVKKTQAEAKQIEADGKQAKAEGKHAEAEAKALRSPGNRAVSEKRAEAKKAEGDQKQAQAAEKKAQADEKRARAEEKQARNEAKSEKNPQKKAEAEKKAESKQAEAEKHKAEGEKHKAEAEQKKVASEKKAEELRVAEGKRKEENRAESAKAFGKVATAGASRESLQAVVGLRHELKTEALKPALSVLENNPDAADLPPCGGSAILCMPAGVQPLSVLPPPLMPTVSFLPQIQRKVALVVGVNKYSDPAIPSLETALPDAQAVGQQLKDSLGYEVRVVPDASRADIITSLNKLAREVGPNDSVTVYYAGHGYLNEKTGNGYWIPGDAKASSPDNWISNNDIAKLLGNIPAKQLMLVSDSCYSGSLTKQQWVGAGQVDPKVILAKRSVTVMSSGGEEPVSDEGKDGHSIFAYNFINALKSVKQVEPAGKVFETVKTEVTKEFPQQPQYGGSVSAGHNTGGDYLFEARSFK